MTRRKLTAEEIDLWHQVVEKTEPLPLSGHATRPLPKPKPVKSVMPRVGVSAEESGRKQKPAQTRSTKPSQAQSVLMDRKSFGRMKRGKLVPEARIDLHGMTLDRAHPVLIRFILTAQASGNRLVLVITGKGRSGSGAEPFAVERGILRRNVPLWLSMPPLAHAVLQVSPAHISHGGDGAFYVYLRRTR